MTAIFARQQAPVIAAEQKVGAERFQLVALLKDGCFGCDEGENGSCWSQLMPGTA